MPKPIISYVIPAYNAETTLYDTVMSIKDTHEVICEKKNKKSEWDKMEVIIVNDGSKDSTLAIANTLHDKHSNIRVIDCGHNGKGASRNIGNMAATSDIIAVLDADDLCLNDRTGTTLKTLEKYPDRALFYSSFFAWHVDINHEEHKEAGPIDRDFLRRTGQFGICHSTVAYRKEAILEHPYAEDPRHDDWFMLWQFFTHQLGFCYSREFLAAYRITRKDVDKAMSKGQTGILEKKQKIMDEYFNKEAITHA